MPERPSFRRRLLVRLGLVLGLALAGVGVAVWGAAAAWSAHEARRALRLEAEAVARDVVTPSGGLDVDRYDWDEPHHRFDAARIDPYFLQVFDAEGRLLRASDNVAGLPSGTLPRRPLARTDEDGAFTRLATLPAGDQRLYRITEPLRTASGAVVGTAQIARYVPTLHDSLGRLALYLVVGLGTLWLALLGLVWTVGGRVVRPLQAITGHAEALSAATLGRRVPIPPHADRETAALAAALNEAEQRLDGAFAEMQRFTANAAHELQTPLTVLRGHVDVTLRRERSPEAYRQTLALLRDEVDEMVRTVRGLLALARLDAQTDALAQEPVELGRLVREEADALRGRAEARRLGLEVEGGEPVWVAAHPELLREVVRNVLDNAVKYTAEGSVTVCVGGDAETGRVVVDDTGPGIPPEHRALATDRFWRADGVQHLPGSGLGLTLAARVLREHGGQLRIEVSPSGGARVVAELPTCSAPPAQPAALAASSREAATAR